MRTKKGIKFNFLTLIEKDPIRSRPQKPKYNFQCDCGNITSQPLWEVKNEIVVSCGCYQKDSRFISPGLASVNDLYTVYKRAAKSRNHNFELNKEQFLFLISENCHYCGSEPKPYNKYCLKNGVPIKLIHRQKSYEEMISRSWIKANGIDRKNNEIGYTIENSVTCCIICNHAKHTMPYDEFIVYLDRLTNFRYKTEG